MIDEIIAKVEKEEELKREHLAFLLQMIVNDKSGELMQLFAAALTEPVQKEVEQQSTVRNIFVPEYLSPGADATYQLDLDNLDAWVIPAGGKLPQNFVKMDQITVPSYNIGSSAEWLEMDARVARFSLLQRVIEKMKNAIIKQEETDGWNIVRSASVAARTVTGANTTLSLANLNDLFEKMQDNRGFEVTDVYVSNKRFADIRDWTQTTISFLTQAEIFKSAGLASLWNATIHKYNSLSDNEVYGFDKRYFGVMPIKSELVILDNSIPLRSQLKQGIISWENVGFACVDNRAVVKLSIPA